MDSRYGTEGQPSHPQDLPYFYRAREASLTGSQKGSWWATCTSVRVISPSCPDKNIPLWLTVEDDGILASVMVDIVRAMCLAGSESEVALCGQASVSSRVPLCSV